MFEADGAVYQERLCPDCGPRRVRIADRVEWYQERVATVVECQAFHSDVGPVRRGCPWDCGPCQVHANACHLPVFSITNACNLDCPICFTYNRPDRHYFMTRAEIRTLLDGLLERTGPVHLVNITGGEPTLHPDLLGLLDECRRPGIGRVTMNSNGLRLARDAELARALADRGVYVVLSFDTLRSDVALTIHGRDVVTDKRAALETLQRFGIGTTLLNVMIRGVNDTEIGAVIDLAREHSVVRSVTVQTMTFTGKGGRQFKPREPMTLDGAARAIESATNGVMRPAHFFPHTRAHPLCYSVAYYLTDNSRWRSLTELFTVTELRSLLRRGYLLDPGDAGPELFRTAIDRLWAAGDPDALLPAMRRWVERLFPAQGPISAVQQQAVAEADLLAVCLHAHMDEDTLDLARLVACPDQVPDPEGRLVPACAYNLFYRQRDPRFWLEAVPVSPINP